jgi:hypothetical protein
MGMAANPFRAHQAGRAFTGRIDVGGVSARDVGAAGTPAYHRKPDSILLNHICQSASALSSALRSAAICLLNFNYPLCEFVCVDFVPYAYAQTRWLLRCRW